MTLDSGTLLRPGGARFACGLEPALGLQSDAEGRAWIAAHHPGLPLTELGPQAWAHTARGAFGDRLLDIAVNGLERRFPELSARRVLTMPQMVIIALMALALVVGCIASPLDVLRFVMGVLSLTFLAGGLFRAALALPGKAAPAAPLQRPSDDGLPTYTILVPLYREASILPSLICALERLDYPRHLLDIKLVLEEDDTQTLAVVGAYRLAAPFEIVIVPPGGPRTKPKAANYALQLARGEYLVVYDAEDWPDADQLWKAVATFRRASRRTACLQAKLNFYNAGHNWLTRGIMAQTPQENRWVAA